MLPPGSISVRNSDATIELSLRRRSWMHPALSFGFHCPRNMTAAFSATMDHLSRFDPLAALRSGIHSGWRRIRLAIGRLGQVADFLRLIRFSFELLLRHRVLLLASTRYHFPGNDGSWMQLACRPSNGRLFARPNVGRAGPRWEDFFTRMVMERGRDDHETHRPTENRNSFFLPNPTRHCAEFGSVWVLRADSEVPDRSCCRAVNTIKKGKSPIAS